MSEFPNLDIHPIARIQKWKLVKDTCHIFVKQGTPRLSDRCRREDSCQFLGQGELDLEATGRSFQYRQSGGAISSTAFRRLRGPDVNRLTGRQDYTSIDGL